jgi:hypothetical protein
MGGPKPLSGQNSAMVVVAAREKYGNVEPAQKDSFKEPGYD